MMGGEGEHRWADLSRGSRHYALLGEQREVAPEVEDVGREARREHLSSRKGGEKLIMRGLTGGSPLHSP